MDALEDDMEDVNTIRSENRPSPENIDLFLPWACQQLLLDLEIVIVNVLSKFADTRRSTKLKLGKSKHKKSKSEIFSDQNSIKSISLNKIPIIHNEKVIKIYTVYDIMGNLIQLKFDKNKIVPRQVLKVIGLITHFHKYLSGITINQGLNKGSLHELNILISHANITDICLDNTCIGDGGYEILLERKTHLRQLSISRCNIGDNTVKIIASKLMHPLPASQTLSLLNLATNFVTDKGAKYLALALRTNRTLVYLNLSDNTITDEGAGAILDIMYEFPISNDELVESRSRHFNYLKEKKELVAEMIIELKSTDIDKRSLIKKRGMKPAPTNIIATNVPQRKSKDKIDDSDACWLEKAELMAEAKLGEFKEPLSPENTEAKYDLIYCKGNNYLAYINLSYNNIAYPTVKKIVSVLAYQQRLNRKPRGLVNISIEGNCIPSTCSELNQIDLILASYIASPPKRMSVSSNTVSLRGKKM